MKRNDNTTFTFRSAFVNDSSGLMPITNQCLLKMSSAMFVKFVFSNEDITSFELCNTCHQSLSVTKISALSEFYEFDYENIQII